MMTGKILKSEKAFIVASFIFAKGADFEWVIMESKDTMQLSVFY